MKTIVKSLFFLLVSISLFSLSFEAEASALTQPKKAGIIGERFDGYVGIVKNASAEIKQLVKGVNLKRKAKYQSIAKKQKLSLKKVELVAGQRAIQKTLKGNYVFLKGKGWVTK